MTFEIEVPGAALRITAAAATSTGLVRAVNEDSYVARHPVFAIADGMGGHARGDRASQQIVATLGALADREGLLSPEHVIDAIRDANDSVRALAAEDGPDVLSGSTLSGVALVSTLSGERAYWMAYNIGDSRVYEWDGRRLAQLSVDHSVVQELVDAGFITSDEARRHPDRNVVTRAIGGSIEVDADVWMLPATESHAFLLCSDGLTKELDDARIGEILAGFDGRSGASIAEALVAAAEEAGGSDNITVVLVESVNRELAENDTIERLERTAERFEDTRPRV